MWLTDNNFPALDADMSYVLYMRNKIIIYF
jgi:hypothetical protein